MGSSQENSIVFGGLKFNCFVRESGRRRLKRSERTFLPKPRKKDSTDETWTVDKAEGVIKLFDPLQHDSYYTRLDGVCNTYLKEVLRGDFKIEKMTELRQPDGHNCGVMVLVYAMIHIKKMEIPEVTSRHLESLRLRFFVQGIKEVLSR
ncbi:hypothetical protein PHMEG_00020978 [Phytophthora megakarya]|uniref:Ubiquitin-like protease family profile domain-containing protein n=1 Tax=Phytophthora megakarya TaxID=4795 RepID=A0A225VN21_9STRA|nr:hypothetical protein PHMEG_00020978 [Phytophthora megakarya]